MSAPAGPSGYGGKERIASSPPPPTAAPQLPEKKSGAVHRSEHARTQVATVAESPTTDQRDYQLPPMRSRRTAPPMGTDTNLNTPTTPINREKPIVDNTSNPEAEHLPKTRVSMTDLTDPHTSNNAWRAVYEGGLYHSMLGEARGFANGDSHAAEDMVQTAMTQVAARLQRGEPLPADTPVAGYFMTTLRNVATNEARRTDRHLSTVSLDAPEQLEAVRNIPGSASVEGEVFVRENAKDILGRLQTAGLNDNQVKALALISEGFSYDEIAQMLDINSTGTVASQLNKGKAKAAKALTVLDTNTDHSETQQQPQGTRQRILTQEPIEQPTQDRYLAIIKKYLRILREGNHEE